MVRAKDIREERQEETVAYRLHALRARALRSELGIPESDGSGGAPTEGVKIVQGDLLDQDVDVIVNAWNRNFIPWWLLIPCGVAGAIRRRGGTRPFRELSRVGVMRLGQAALTSAGRLPHKGIIHVAALTWYWRSNERAVREGTINAYTLAADSGFTSIAFPLLGSGTGGMKRERAKRIMLDALSSCDRGVRAILVEFDKRSKRVQTAPPASEALQ
ncbi:MAG: macro domain-containing protein [Phycisphaeraceae bacterium]|nr:macro domain-containing protein [Phycisphaeraceae bacterium]